ncbi:MAG: hypothetical protein IPK19_41895 [Chloroflexi bacterium]|nr:hypothetical protein [Chloroflexota bacterium]
MTIKSTHDAEESHGHDRFTPAQRADNRKTAVWLYLGSEVVLFSVLIAAFILYRLNSQRIKEVHETAGVLLVAINTFLLLASSWAMVMGLQELARATQQGLMR